MTASTELGLDEQLCFALYAATNAVVRTYRPLLDAIGLTYPQYLVMLVLWQDGERAVHEIADRLHLPPHALAPLLGRLERSGLVQRRRLAPDRRVVRVRLTAAGRELRSTAAAVQHSVVCHTGLSADALDALRDELHELVERMECLTAPPTPSAGL